MHAAPAPHRENSVASRERRPARIGVTRSWCTTLPLERVGYLVPDADFDAAVHSVFARACNFACGDSLLTLVTHDLADGPTTLRLASTAVPDFRLNFRPGERLRCRDGVAFAPGVAMRLANAVIWRPLPPRAAVSTRRLDANLRFATVALKHRRRTHSSVIDREGSGVLAGLGASCCRLDVGSTTACIERLIGWGEGLTPAGDDVLVGWCAALGTLAHDHDDRTRFLRESCAAIMARTPWTTPIAAHYLRLAAQGHFNADVIRLRNALAGESDTTVVANALGSALDAGATSGADMVTGLLCGFRAWSPAGVLAGIEAPPR